MNYFDIVFIAVSVLMIISGMRRGLLVSMISTLKYVVGLPLSYFLSNVLNQRLYDSFVKELVYKSVLDQISKSRSREAFLNSIHTIVSDMPDYLKKSIDLSSLNNMTSEEISKSLTNTILEPISLTILKIVIFIVVFVVFCIVLNIFISIFTKLQQKEHMPLKHTNRFFGGLFGLVKAAVMLFTVSTVIGIICGVIPQDNSFIKQVEDSYVLEFINTNNPLLK